MTAQGKRVSEKISDTEKATGAQKMSVAQMTPEIEKTPSFLKTPDSREAYEFESPPQSESALETQWMRESDLTAEEAEWIPEVPERPSIRNRARAGRPRKRRNPY
jgi:hypothetical protein